MDYKIDEFLESAFYDALTDAQKESAAFTLDTFISYMSDYEGVEQASGWNSRNVQVVCLEWIPKKVTAEIGFFENYGEILISFFKFLDTDGTIKNAKALQKTVADINSKIPVVASDPRNWGMAKSMMMKATQSGYDISSKEDLNHFMLDYNQQAMDRLSQSKPKPLIDNPYKKMGRNDKISVKYADGTLKENIKFKVVEQDLIDGKCDMIK